MLPIFKYWAPLPDKHLLPLLKDTKQLRATHVAKVKSKMDSIPSWRFKSFGRKPLKLKSTLRVWTGLKRSLTQRTPLSLNPKVFSRWLNYSRYYGIKITRKRLTRKYHLLKRKHRLLKRRELAQQKVMRLLVSDRRRLKIRTYLYGNNHATIIHYKQHPISRRKPRKHKAKKKRVRKRWGNRYHLIRQFFNKKRFRFKVRRPNVFRRFLNPALRRTRPFYAGARQLRYKLFWAGHESAWGKRLTKYKQRRVRRLWFNPKFLVTSNSSRNWVYKIRWNRPKGSDSYKPRYIRRYIQRVFHRFRRKFTHRLEVSGRHLVYRSGIHSRKDPRRYLYLFRKLSLPSFYVSPSSSTLPVLAVFLKQPNLTLQILPLTLFQDSYYSTLLGWLLKSCAETFVIHSNSYRSNLNPLIRVLNTLPQTFNLLTKNLYRSIQPRGLHSYTKVYTKPFNRRRAFIWHNPNLRSRLDYRLFGRWIHLSRQLMRSLDSNRYKSLPLCDIPLDVFLDRELIVINRLFTEYNPRTLYYSKNPSLSLESSVSTFLQRGLTGINIENGWRRLLSRSSLGPHPVCNSSFSDWVSIAGVTTIAGSHKRRKLLLKKRLKRYRKRYHLRRLNTRRRSLTRRYRRSKVLLNRTRVKRRVRYYFSTLNERNLSTRLQPGIGTTWLQAESRVPTPVVGRNLSSLAYNTPFIKIILNSSLLSKFAYLTKNLSAALSPHHLMSLDSVYLGGRESWYGRSNLIPSSSFSLTLKRRIFRILTFNRFSVNITMWYYNYLVKFIENCSGRKVYLKFNSSIENDLSFDDLARCNLWYLRILGFQRILGPRIFLKESLHILTLILKVKDPALMVNWVKAMLSRLSFWKQRLIFRYIKYVMRYLFWGIFPHLGFKGMKLKLKGKISVAGNARTRTLLYRIGETSHSTFDNKIAHHFTTISTFTGVLGFQIWFFF